MAICVAVATLTHALLLAGPAPSPKRGVVGSRMISLRLLLPGEAPRAVTADLPVVAVAPAAAPAGRKERPVAPPPEAPASQPTAAAAASDTLGALEAKVTQRAMATPEIATADEEAFLPPERLTRWPRPRELPVLEADAAAAMAAEPARVELLIDEVGRLVRVRRIEGLRSSSAWAIVQRQLLWLSFEPGRIGATPVKVALPLELTLDGDRLHWPWARNGEGTACAEPGGMNTARRSVVVFQSSSRGD